MELKWVLIVCGRQREAGERSRTMATQTRTFDQRFATLRVFLKDYLHPHGLHDPVAFLRRGAKRPAWFGTACANNRGGVRHYINVRRFLAWVSENCEPFSEDARGGGSAPCQRRKYWPVRGADSLVATEREALAKTVSTEWLDEHGLKISSHGALLNKHGRELLPVGLCQACENCSAPTPWLPQPHAETPHQSK